MNVFTFSGDIPRPAEQRRTQSDKAVVSFTVPVKSGFGVNEDPAILCRFIKDALRYRYEQQTGKTAR